VHGLGTESAKYLDMTSAPVIQSPDWHLPFEIMCDVSDYVVGAVLGQSKDKKHYAISYASKL
jgi:hypothetical protein